MEKNNWKGWLYLLPASVFLGLFLVYPLIDVLTYSFEEGYNFASQTYFGTGLYNYHYVLRDPYFLQALKNTLLLVLITVPLSTGLAMLISVGLSSIQKLRELYQTVYFLPYVTNTLAVGLVFMIFFKRTPYSDGLVNLVLKLVRRGAGGLHRRALLGEDVRSLLLHHLGRSALQNPDPHRGAGLR